MNKRRICILISAIVLIGGAATTFLVESDEAISAGMISHCSELVRENMKSPDSFKMTNGATIFNELSKVSAEEVINESEYLKSEFHAGNLSVREAKTYINFQSENALGVSLKGTAECTYDSIGNNWNSISSASIDGNMLPKSVVITSAVKEARNISDSISSKMKYVFYKMAGKM